MKINDEVTLSSRTHFFLTGGIARSQWLVTLSQMRINAFLPGISWTHPKHLQSHSDSENHPYIK